MAEIKVDIIQKQAQILFGVWKNTNDRTISKDIAMLSKEYHTITTSAEGSVLPYFVLSKDYDEQSRCSQLFIGSTTSHTGLEQLALEAGEYASLTVKPKLGFLWGAAVGEAKQYFYTKWLPNSDYCGLNMEYEYHTEKSIGKHPTVELLFAVRHRQTD